MHEHLSLLLQLYLRPWRAMSGILDRGNWMFGVIAAVALTYLLSWFLPVSISAVLTVFCIFVPLCVALVVGFERLGSITTALSRDFAPLLACCSLAWIAAELPLSLFAKAPVQVRQIILPAAVLYFLFLMFCAVRVVFGAGFVSSAASVLLATFATGILIVTGILGIVIPFIASPFILLYGYWYFGRNLQSIGQGFRNRQAFRRNLEAATVNPRDADARTQLGLIYQARRQFQQATERFQEAIAIDPNDPEAHLQLGRILRDQGHPDKALPHFQAVAKIDPKYSSHEMWREAGSVYLALGRYRDAAPVLDHYVSQRPFDAEGLYYYGQVLAHLRETAKAREMFERAVEAARTAPYHRKRFVNRWGRMAQRALRDLA